MIRLIAAILIPVVSLLAWVFMIQRDIYTGTEVMVKVAAYDPRDLLAGHYMLFRLDLGENGTCKSYSRGDQCVCLAPNSSGGFHESYWYGKCYEKPTECSLFLKGSCEAGSFSAGVEQYFIPERLSPVLLRVPDNSKVKLVVNGRGDSRVTGLYVGDETVEEYGERMLKEKGGQ